MGTRRCEDCGFDINERDWDEHRAAEMRDAVNNYREMFTEVGHE